MDSILLLDLDNTLISASDYILPVSETIKYKLRYCNFENVYTIFERPFLQTFLNFVFKKYQNVGIFTAADPHYAIFVIENFITHKNNRSIKILLTSTNCQECTNMYGFPKKIEYVRKFYKKLGSITLIDDLVEVARENKGENVITIKPFEYNTKDSYRDRELLNMIKIMEKN